MSKTNAERFCTLYQQHKAIAKQLAGLDTKSEDTVLAGLVKIAKELGLICTKEELKKVADDYKKSGQIGGLDALAGGTGGYTDPQGMCSGSCGGD